MLMAGHQVPQERVRRASAAPPRERGRFVLYWMTANRRLGWNFALQHAVDWARRLHQPLLILETLPVDAPWASDRFHGFVMEGMAEKQRQLADSAVSYHPYVESEPNSIAGLLAVVSAEASVVITDDRPAFLYPKAHAAHAAGIEAPLEAVDSNGVLPLATADRSFPTAHSFRRFLQKNLDPYLQDFPSPDPLAGPGLPALGQAIVDELLRRAGATGAKDIGNPRTLQTLPIDHGVAALPAIGGSTAGRARLIGFVESLLPTYGQQRNHPDRDNGSGLSPYLHFGHVSAHEIFAAIADVEEWSLDKLADSTTGARQGWWGMSESSEVFVDQLVTWRELGFNMCHQRSDHDAYSSLPDWALATLDAHRHDERPHTYSLDQVEAAATHDEIWNAAQTELVIEGRVHNYLRMLWGKKILEWSASPEEALWTMIHLNNKYALDGRDPNSYSGIFWVLGRYDRAWGPERPIFGKIRYMSSENTARKLRIKEYLRRFGPHRGEDTAA